MMIMTVKMMILSNSYMTMIIFKIRRTKYLTFSKNFEDNLASLELVHFNPIPMPRCHILWEIHFCWMWTLTPAQFLQCEPYCEFQFYSNVNKYTSISTPNVSNEFSNLNYSRSIIHNWQMICDFLLSSLAVQLLAAKVLVDYLRSMITIQYNPIQSIHIQQWKRPLHWRSNLIRF